MEFPSIDAADIAKQLVVTGDFEHSEFASLREAFPSASFVSCEDILRSTAEATATADADLLLVCETLPGQWSEADWLRLKSCCPQTEMWLVVSAWGEGSTRTAFPWPGAKFVYVHQVIDELEAFMSGGKSSSRRAAPRLGTWTRADELLARTVATESTTSSEDHAAAGQATAWIRSFEKETADALSDELRFAGWQTEWLPAANELADTSNFLTASGGSELPSEGAGDVRVILWYGDVTRDAEADRLSNLSKRCPEIPIVAMLHFPRREDHAKAIASGAARVVSLPMQQRMGDWLARFCRTREVKTN